MHACMQTDRKIESSRYCEIALSTSYSNFNRYYGPVNHTIMGHAGRKRARCVTVPPRPSSSGLPVATYMQGETEQKC